MGSLFDIFLKYNNLLEEAFDLDDEGNLIEKNASKIAEADSLFHEIFVSDMGEILKELAYDPHAPQRQETQWDEYPSWLTPSALSVLRPRQQSNTQQGNAAQSPISGDTRRVVTKVHTSRPDLIHGTGLRQQNAEFGQPGTPTKDDPRGMIPIIRAAAIKYGHDPDIAVQVARSEGLGKYTGDNGKSFGAFQLFTGGGIGNEYKKAFPDRDPSDPVNEPHMIDYTMSRLAKDGWGPYHGAAKSGIGPRSGIGVYQPQPTSTASATQQNFRKGAANYATSQNFGDPRHPEWQKQNLSTIKSPSGATVQVHKNAAPAFQGFVNDLENSGYKVNSSGGYNLRNIRGSNNLSQHAYGNAIDINAVQNPMGSGPMKTNMPSNISDLAAKWGISWGGDWKTRKDPMHFEWNGVTPSNQATQVAQKQPTSQPSIQNRPLAGTSNVPPQMQTAAIKPPQPPPPRTTMASLPLVGSQTLNQPVPPPSTTPTPMKTPSPLPGAPQNMPPPVSTPPSATIPPPPPVTTPLTGNQRMAALSPIPLSNDPRFIETRSRTAIRLLRG